MRGKVQALIAALPSIRITPAYAGKSIHTSCYYNLPEDHPRLCGEKHPAARAHIILVGSPPPMRGKVLFSFFHETFYRITPAYAGKSSCSV